MGIVGVLPRGFAYPIASDRPTEIYAPLWFRAEDKVHGESHNYNWTAIGRLKKGVSLRQAHDQMNRVSDVLEKQYPKWSPGRRVQVIALQEHLVGRVRPWMLMLLGAVGARPAHRVRERREPDAFARSTVRAREMGIRAALGAGRWRLMRALLIEGIVLSLTGALIGIVLAYGGVQLLRTWLPSGVPRVASIGIDLRVLITAIAAALLTGVFFGIVPALQSSRPDLTTSLKDSGRSSTTGVASQRLRGALVIAEVALAVVLLVGAGLFTRSFVRLMRVDTGLDYHNVLVLNVGIRFDFNKPGEYKRLLPQGRIYLEQMLDAVSRVPGVEQAATVGGGLPLTGSWSRTGSRSPDAAISKAMTTRSTSGP